MRLKYEVELDAKEIDTQGSHTYLVALCCGGIMEDPIALAKACYNMYPLEFDNIKIIEHEDNGCIEDVIEWW